MKVKILIIILMSIFLTGCVNNSEETELEVKPESKDLRKISLTEISQHNTQDDCWLVINNKVYEVTEFVSKHPGGRALLEGCGKNATELFDTRPMGSKTPHSERANSLLLKYFIGDLDE